MATVGDAKLMVGDYSQPTRAELATRHSAVTQLDIDRMTTSAAPWGRFISRAPMTHAHSR
jgi:hypothetical protein